MIDFLLGIWAKLHNKAFVFIFLIAAFGVQLKTGYFRFFIAYLKSLRPGKSFLAGLLLSLAIFFAGLILLDAPLSLVAKEASGWFSDAAWNYGAEWGRGIWIYLAVLYIIFIHKAEDRDLVFGAALATMLTGLSAVILKSLVVRARPAAGEGAFSFFNWSEWGQRLFESFPSGDVSIVAGACFFLLLVYKKNIAAAVFLFLTPLATSYARMHLERHWFSDTWVAMAMGLGWAFFFWSYERFRRPLLKSLRK